MTEPGSEYLKDESRQFGNADEIIFAEDFRDIAGVFQRCHAVTIQGARTGISGACVPTEGAVLNLSRMKGVTGRGKNERGEYLDVLAGTTLEEIEKAAGADFFFPPDPTEKTASIGGMLALNAAGPSALRYGTTIQHVTEADVWFPSFGWMTVKRGAHVFSKDGVLTLENGCSLQIPLLPAGSKVMVRQLTPTAGMDLLELLAGSEGMLGVFGRIRIQLHPAEREKWSLLCFFEEEENALKFAEQVLEATENRDGVQLLSDDYLDKNCLTCYQKYAKTRGQYHCIPTVPDGKCAVMLELAGGEKEKLWETLENLLVLLDSCGGDDALTWAADSQQEREKIRMFRHAVPECINAEVERIQRTHQEFSKLSLDAACCKVPAGEFFRMLAETSEVPYTVINHVGRGIYHIDFLPKTREEIPKAMASCRGVAAYVYQKNGFLAAENGAGKGKNEILRPYISDRQMDIMRRVKAFFDPKSQCNVGNIWNENHCVYKTGA